MRRALAVLVFILALPAAALSHSAQVGDISIGHMWASPTAPDAEGAMVFMPLLNRGEAPDRLIGASTEIAEDAYLREGTGDDARRLNGLDLEPGEPVALAEWRAHIWLDGLKAPLEDGEAFALTITFERAGEVTFEVYVESEPGH